MWRVGGDCCEGPREAASEGEDSGKLEAEEEIGVEPNGTEFVIITKDMPELDQSVLVVGRVVEGMDVVEKLTQVKTVQENTSSPYFR